ncbi:MAG: isopentenyl-diphosphate Delta-isomerase [Bacteroidales bacterium]|nr:isopentenyl-diphosphate Delta-isomerase [Bacteroidales bacterium]
MTEADSTNEYVILVDRQDQPVGIMEKMEAHKRAELHRAFSVFVVNSKGELMLQRRAMTKYHSPGLWTNTCCSHPRQGESVEDAAHRRLEEEMGFDCSLAKVFDFIYKADVGQGLYEHEFDHVLTGIYDDEPLINTHEVMEWKWMGINELKEDIQKYPGHYTVWFRIAFDRFVHHLKGKAL